MNKYPNFESKKFTLPEVIFLEKVCDLVEEGHQLSKDAALKGYGITGLARDYLKNYNLDLQCAYVHILTAYKDITLDEDEIGWLVNEARGPRFAFAATPLQLAKEILYKVSQAEKFLPSTQKMSVFENLQKEFLQFSNENAENFKDSPSQVKLLHAIMELEALNYIILPNFGKEQHSFETTTNHLIHTYVPEKLNYEYVLYADPVSNAKLFNSLFEEFQNAFNTLAKDTSEHKKHIEAIADKDFIEKIFAVKHIADDFLVQETAPGMEN